MRNGASKPQPPKSVSYSGAATAVQQIESSSVHSPATVNGHFGTACSSCVEMLWKRSPISILKYSRTELSAICQPLPCDRQTPKKLLRIAAKINNSCYSFVAVAVAVVAPNARGRQLPTPELREGVSSQGRLVCTVCSGSSCYCNVLGVAAGKVWSADASGPTASI